MGATTAPGAGADVTPATRIAAAFCSVLRGAGVEVSLNRTQSFLEALTRVGVGDRASVYWAGRATLLGDPESIEVYDRAFAVFWEHRRSSGRPVEEPPPIQVTLATDEESEDADSGDGEEEQPDGPVIHLRYSDVEVLRHKDFAECEPAELEELRRLMDEFRYRVPTRPSRRLVATSRRSRRPDLRRTVRRAMATGGEPVRREFRRPDRRPRRVILLVDVSGSMEAYARVLLRFAHAVIMGRTRVEAFTIGTRLTRVTRELASLDPDAAMKAAAASVQDWSGGTRLGDTLREFNDRWAVRGMARGAVVVVLSDGWDRGDPTVLAEQMQRLHRVTHRLVWVNPLKHTPGYAPLARGMAAALPHVDRFLEGHALDSLENLVAVISD